MQVNNNVQSPNFGMALKIKCTAKDLENAGAQVIERLGKAGEELADTKYWDLEVLKGSGSSPLQYRVNGNFCANAYIGDIRGKAIPRDEFLTIKSTWDGIEGVGGNKKGEVCETVMRFANKDAAIKAYESLNTYYTYSSGSLENAVAATKVLEEWTKYQNAVQAKENELAAQTRQAAADLLNKYGSFLENFH